MVGKTIFKTAYEKNPMSKQQNQLESNDSRNLSSESIICLGEKEISPKVLKITPRELMITFGVIEVGV